MELSELNKLNKGLKFNGWYIYYNGLVCGNIGTPLHIRITNKGKQVYKADKK